MKNATLKHHLSQKWLNFLADFVQRFHLLIILVFTGLTVYFGSLALNLEQKTTIQDLLPVDNQVVARFDETVHDFNLVDNLVIVLSFAPKNMEMAQNFADILVDSVREDPEYADNLKWIHGNLFERLEYSNWESFIQYVPKFLPPDRISQLVLRLSKEGIQSQVRKNYEDLASGLAIKILIEKDPLGLLDLVTPYRSEITGNYRLDLSEGYLESQDHKMLLILARPKESPENVDFAVKVTDFLERKIEDAHKAYFEEEGVSSKDQINVALTGAHPITAHENQTIRGDVISMFISSFTLVLLLFIVAYRRPMAVFYVGIPLLLAEVWTMGTGYLLFGRLNLLTATFSAVIVGLGIDYAIHIFSRYLDERTKGHSPSISIKTSLVETGMGTLTGGVTTALAFLAMSMTEFSGLREFAFMAALGIGFCLIQMFVLLPSILMLRERWRSRPTHKIKEQWDFKIEPVLRLCFRYKKIVLATLGLLTVFAIYQTLHIRFNSDIRSVRAQSNPAIQLQSEVTEKVGGSLRSLTFVLNSKTEEGLFDLHDRLMPVLNHLRDEGLIARYDSLLNFLQPPKSQLRNIEILKEAGITGESVKNDFLAAQSKQGFRVTEENLNYIKYLAQGIESKKPISISDVLTDEGHLVSQFLVKKEKPDGELFKTVVHVFPSKGLWEKAATNQVVDEVLNALPSKGDSFAYVTGIQTISDEIKRLVHDSFNITTFLAAFLVIITLVIHFKRSSLVLLTLAPLATSIFWMLGTMVTCGFEINLLNFVATPIIIGIGIDDGIHIVEKYLHRSSQSLIRLMVSCGKAVTLTSLTTILGFSSLFLADYSGFRSLGLSAILGVFYAWFFSVILLPLLMSFFKIKFVRSKIRHGGKS